MSTLFNKPSYWAFSALVLLVVLTGGCDSRPKPAVSEARTASAKARFEELIRKGDSIYATKTGSYAFEQSLVCFDSAEHIAKESGDQQMMAEGMFAKGRVYDAWGNDPASTISLFEQAANTYKALGNNVVREYYIRHLIAHTYEKSKDSSNCVKYIQLLLKDIKAMPDSTRRKMEYIPQLAQICVIVKNYALAEDILSKYYERAWIQNNPETYNFEDYYYDTKTAIDFYHHKLGSSPYLDSLRQRLAFQVTPLDSLWLLDELVRFHAHVKDYSYAFDFSQKYYSLRDRVLTPKGLGNLQNKLLQLELQNERRDREEEKANRKRRNRLMLGLCAVLVVISILTLKVYSASKHHRELAKQLATKIDEVHLANKEIQHRVKNNLHTIFSLLNMQERRVDNPEVAEQLQNARIRVESIAALHDQLSRNENHELNFNQYIQKLVHTIVECVASEQRIITQLDLQSISLPHNHYFAIGLIINEWITNSIKYAQSTSALVLHMRMEQTSKGVEIEYYDNGKELPSTNIEVGLGSEIIQLLTQQLKGTLTRPTQNPYHYLLVVPNNAT